MKPGVVLAVSSIALAIVAQLGLLPSEAGWASSADGTMNVAQRGREARDGGAAARSDALMGTPNKKTPAPQDNLFSTSPRLEQQPTAAEPPAPRGAAPARPAPSR